MLINVNYHHFVNIYILFYLFVLFFILYLLHQTITIKQNAMIQVTHNTFGIGTVVSEKDGNITINFNGVEKTLIVKFAGLKNLDGSDYGDVFVAHVKKSKKLNPANFFHGKELPMMTNSEFEERNRIAARNCKSW